MALIQNIHGDANPPVDENNCIMCLSEMDDPVELVECKHVFCKDCNGVAL
jgi:hypothetical protein